MVGAGGEEESQTEYEDAVQAIFHLQLERYCHTQAHHNPEKGGAMRWECIEMWPMQVSHTHIACILSFPLEKLSLTVFLLQKDSFSPLEELFVLFRETVFPLQRNCLSPPDELSFPLRGSRHAHMRCTSGATLRASCALYLSGVVMSQASDGICIVRNNCTLCTDSSCLLLHSCWHKQFECKLICT